MFTFLVCIEEDAKTGKMVESKPLSRSLPAI